ncbi:unnamed protein product, partial [Polarella glacialis]
LGVTDGPACAPWYGVCHRLVGAVAGRRPSQQEELHLPEGGDLMPFGVGFGREESLALIAILA